MSRRRVAVEDLLKVSFPHDPELSPDGQRVVFAVARLDHDANQWRSNLWLASTGGGEPRSFTSDEARDTSPVWSPDGRWIAFLSNRGGGRRGRTRAPMQLWVIAADGGEARQLISFKSGVSQPVWSPDSRTLAFVARGDLDHPEPGPRVEEEWVVREITRPKYKYDALGFFEDYAQIWTVSLEGGPAQITHGNFDHEWPAWLPDGGEIVCVANRAAEADFSFARDLWAVAVRSGEMRQLTHHTGPILSPIVSPDGRWIAFAGHDFHAKSATNVNVWMVPVSGGQSTNLTAGFDRSVGNAVGSDVRLAPLFPSVAWTPDGAGLIFYATDSGQTHLYRVQIADGAVRPLTDGQEVVADLAAAGGAIVYQRAGPTALDELWLLPAGGEPRRLTGLNDALAVDLEITAPRHFRYTGADGWPMDGWLLTPPGFDASRKYPAVLRVHGGPHAAYGDVFSHEVALFASRGFVLLWTNPRGSGGYGEAFTKAVVGDWGGKDSQDILLGLDHAIAQGFIDPDRVAVMGGSYGGFMTNWLIGHTQRFRCAISEVCVSNLHNFFSSSDIGPTWGEAEWGATPWDDPQTLLAHSPIMYARNVTTPVLITANEEDHRCPIEQSEQFFIALRKLGKDATFLRFAGESHMMASTGRPKPRIERLCRLVAWLEKYLTPVPVAVAGAGGDEGWTVSGRS